VGIATGSTTAGALSAVSVAELVEATIIELFPQRAF